MISVVNIGAQRVLAKIRLFSLMVLVGVGSTACQWLKPTVPEKPITAPPSKTSEPKQPPKVVDTKAQQQQYDRGVQAYSQEKYEEAKAAFQRAIDIGPKTELGQKARENLKKVLQVLKTVEEIKSK